MRQEASFLGSQAKKAANHSINSCCANSYDKKKGPRLESWTLFASVFMHEEKLRRSTPLVKSIHDTSEVVPRMYYSAFVAGVYGTVIHKVQMKHGFSDISSLANTTRPAAGGQQHY